MVGSDPANFKSLADDAKMPDSREQSCKRDYAKASRFVGATPLPWDSLNPFSKDTARGSWTPWKLPHLTLRPNPRPFAASKPAGNDCRRTMKFAPAA
jgi:hypothetical protein